MQQVATAHAGQVRVILWDLPVRLAHWGFVALIPALWWTAEEGKIGIHEVLGLTMLGLVVFRLLWGLVGSTTARFSHFVKGPGEVLVYARGLFSKTAHPVVGHNALGGWSVVTLLSLLTLQVSLGLFAEDVDGMKSGPLAHLVSFGVANGARELHGIVFDFILVFAGLHIAAILFYLLVKRDNLVRPMVTGGRSFALPVVEPVIAPLWRAALCALLAAGLAVWIGQGAPLPGL